MANVDVQHQPSSHPYYDQHVSSTSSISVLQGPLPLSRHAISATIQNSTSTHQETKQTQTKSQQQQQHVVPHYSTLRKPIPNSYWATPYLLACEYPWAPSTPRPKLDLLLASGIRTFIDLTVSGELLSYSQLLPLRAHSAGLPPSESQTLEYVRFPIPDRSLPPSPAFLAKILSVLARCEKEKRIAAVHCRGGIGRTGTIIGCWLVQSGRCRDGEEALRVLAEKWKTVEKCARFPCSPETGPQAEFVRRFKKIEGVDVNVNPGAGAGAGAGGMGTKTKASATTIASKTSAATTATATTTTTTTTTTTATATKHAEIENTTVSTTATAAVTATSSATSVPEPAPAPEPASALTDQGPEIE